MPLGPGVRYRWIKKGGKMIRLAFRGNKVIEVKKKGGVAHRVDQRRKKRKKRSRKSAT